MIDKIKYLLSEYRTVELICINKEEFIANSSLNIDILEKRIIVGFIDGDDTVITTFGDYITPYELQFFKVKEIVNVDVNLIDSLIRQSVTLETYIHFNIPINTPIENNEEYKKFFDERYRCFMNKLVVDFNTIS